MSETRQIAIDLLQATTPGKMEEVVKRLLEHERKKMFAARPPAMTWTMERPTKEGWYWRRNSEWPNGYMIQIEQNDLNGMANKGWYPGGQWAGPIEPPQ